MKMSKQLVKKLFRKEGRSMSLKTQPITIEKKVAETEKRKPDQPEFVPCDSDHPDGIGLGRKCAND